MKKKALLIKAVSLLLFGTSCYYDSAPAEEELPPPEDDISFEESILPIIESYNCAGCHNGSTPPDLRSENAYNSLLRDYVVPGDAEASVFFQRLPGKDHPQVGFGLTNNEISLIEAWINEGALE